MRLFVPSNAPQWLAGFARDVEGAIRGPCDAPVRLADYAEAAALPAASDWPFGMAYVRDIQMVALSTGSGWVRLDTGAAL